MSKIAIYTFIGHNSSKYADQLYRNATFMCSDNNNIHYYCFRTIGNSQYKDEPLPKNWELISDVPAHPYSNSMCHAYCLNAAIAHAYESGDARYIILCDADVAILYQDWDIAVLEHLKKYDVFSFENNKYGLPGVAFFAFKKSLLDKYMFDFKPLLKLDSESCDRMTLLGLTIKCDTAFKIVELAYTGQISYFNIGLNKGIPKLPYRDEEHKALCLSKPTHMQEYLLNGELFGAHLQASRSDSIDSEYGKAWLWRVYEFFKSNHGVYLCYEKDNM